MLGAEEAAIECIDVDVVVIGCGLCEPALVDVVMMSVHRQDQQIHLKCACIAFEHVSLCCRFHFLQFLEEMAENKIIHRKDTMAIKVMRRCVGIRAKAKVCMGSQMDQYLVSNPLL